jgi:alkylhydroperoxidase/carboxymuconolactone decarboxylase family protein YurZ
MTVGHPADSLAFVEGYPAVFDNFLAEVDVQTTGHLDERTRHIVRIAAVIACDATTVYPAMLTAALETGQLTASEAGEVVVQSVPYVGMGRVDAFALLTSEVLTARGAQLPPSNIWASTRSPRHHEVDSGSGGFDVRTGRLGSTGPVPTVGRRVSGHAPLH